MELSEEKTLITHIDDELGQNYEKNFLNQNGICLGMLFCVLSLGVLLFGFIKEGSSGQPNTSKFRMIKAFIMIIFLAFAAFINYNVYNQRLNYEPNASKSTSFNCMNFEQLNKLCGSNSSIKIK